MTQQFAMEHFDELLSALAKGEIVAIERPGQLALHLSAEAAEAPVEHRERILGAGVGELRVLSDDEWDQIDKEWRESFAGKFDRDVA